MTGRRRSQLKHIKRSVKTRWNSELICAKSFLPLRSFVEEATRRDGYTGPRALSPEEVAIVEDFVLLMDPVNEMTEILSGEYYSTSSVYFIT